MKDPVELLRQMMDQLGISIEDLAKPRTDEEVKQSDTTVAGFVEVVRRVAPDTIFRTYDSYWIRLVDELGSMKLREVRSSDIADWVGKIKKGVVVRRNARGAVGAQQNAISAARFFFKIAVNDRLIKVNPASSVPKPKRPPSNRRALTNEEVDAAGRYRQRRG